jgi:hypothetical protein
LLGSDKWRVVNDEAEVRKCRFLSAQIRGASE